MGQAASVRELPLVGRRFKVAIFGYGKLEGI